MRSIYQKLGARRFFTAAFVTVIAAALILSLIFALLPSSVTKLDISGSGAYTLSDESVKTASSVGEDVTLYLIASADSESEQTMTVLERYSAKSPKIKVKTLYAETDKSVINQYTVYDEYTDGGVIVESAQRSLYIPAHLFLSYGTDALNYAMQLYSYYYQNGETELTFSEFLEYNGEYLALNDGYCYESRINTALKYVTDDNVKTVYFASGSVSEYFSDGLRLELASNLTEIKDVSLKTEAIPTDASAIILMPTQTDIGSDEKSKLSDYVKNGGQVLLMSSYGVDSYENLSALCSELGISSASPYVFEDNASYCFGSAETLLPDIGSDAAGNALSADQSVLLPLCTEIKVAETLPDGVSTQTVFISSAEAFINVDNNYTFNEDTETRGARLLGVKASYSQGGGLTYIASSFMLIEDFGYYSNNGNKTAFFAILNEMTGSTQLSDTTEPITLSTDYLTVSKNALYGFIAVGASLTLAVIATGVIKAFRRENR